MSEQLIVRHCSPTLAGIKTGNIFSSEYKDQTEVGEYLRRINMLLKHKGLRAIPLRFSKERVLIYVYRPELLAHDLNDGKAYEMLKKFGYDSSSTDMCVIKLLKRINDSDNFPHEIGFFLGYPPEDVCGFIESRPGSCKYTGLWKVYGDVDSALRIFEKYKKCTDIYTKQWESGSSLEKLTVKNSAVLNKKRRYPA